MRLGELITSCMYRVSLVKPREISGLTGYEIFIQIMNRNAQVIVIVSFFVTDLIFSFLVIILIPPPPKKYKIRVLRSPTLRSSVSPISTF